MALLWFFVIALGGLLYVVGMTVLAIGPLTLALTIGPGYVGDIGAAVGGFLGLAWLVAVALWSLDLDE